MQSCIKQSKIAKRLGRLSIKFVTVPKKLKKVINNFWLPFVLLFIWGSYLVVSIPLPLSLDTLLIQAIFLATALTYHWLWLKKNKKILAFKDKKNKLLEMSDLLSTEQQSSLQYELAEHQKTKNSLAQFKQKLKMVTDSIPQGIYIKDENKNFIFSSLNYTDIFSVNTNELMEREITDAKLFRDSILLQEEKSRNGSKRLTSKDWLVNGDGSRSYTEIIHSSYVDVVSRQKLVLGVVSDSSETLYFNKINQQRTDVLNSLDRGENALLTLSEIINDASNALKNSPISLLLFKNETDCFDCLISDTVSTALNKSLQILKNMRMLFDELGIEQSRSSIIRVSQLHSKFKQLKQVCHNEGIKAFYLQPIPGKKGSFPGVVLVFSGSEKVFDKKCVGFISELSSLSSLIIQRENSKRAIKQFNAVVHSSSSAIMLVSSEGIIDYVNPSFKKVLGFNNTQIQGKSFWMLQPEGDCGRPFYELANAHKKSQIWKGKLEIKHVDDKIIHVKAVLCPPESLADNSVIILDDLTEIHSATKKVVNLSFYDPVTGLNNRALLFERLQQSIDSVIRKDNRLAAVLIDLDRFKRINDTLGSDIGDMVLKDIAARIKDTVRKEDIVARMDSDLFAVIITGFDEPTRLRNIVQKLLNAIEKPISIGGKNIVVSASAGIGIGPDDGRNSKDLIRNVSMALYRAKANGRQQFEFYEYQLNKASKQKFNLESEMRLGIERNEFFVMYQPIVDSMTGAITSAEALLRWTNPMRGLVSPVDFIPIAEETGLIKPLGDFVINQTCQLLSSLGDNALRIRVNLSVRQIHDSNFADKIKSVLIENQVTENFFGLELTESLLMEDDGAGIEQLTKLNKMGISIAIDDFGTGYSSLGYLKNFPVDTLKIDKSFIQNLSTNDNNRALVEAIVAIAQKLDLKVIAEGVEALSEFRILRKLKYENLSIQGFLFSKPLMSDELSRLVMKNKKYQVVAWV